MRVTRLLIAAFLGLSLAGCHLLVSTDDLFVKLAPTSIAQDGQTTTMISSVVSLTFDCGDTTGCALTQARIPAASGENLLYAGGASSEQLAGISYWAYNYSWESDELGGLSPVQAGGPVSRVRLDWHTTDVEGSSVYTLHPDGRLYRDETVTVTTPHVDAENPPYLLAYQAIDATKVTTLTWKEGYTQGSVRPLMANQDIQLGHGLGYACAADERKGDVVSWAHHDGQASALVDWRFSEVADDISSSILMASDWVNNGEPPVETAYSGQFLSAFNASGDCGTVQEQTELFQSPPRVTTSVGDVVVDQAGDNDHDGFNEGGGFFEIQAAGDEVRVRTDANLPTCTIRIWGAPNRKVPEIILGGEELTNVGDFLFGGGANDEVWLYLDHPWGGGSELRIRWP
jgi:hypothetical protein